MCVLSTDLFMTSLCASFVVLTFLVTVFHEIARVVRTLKDGDETVAVYATEDLAANQPVHAITQSHRGR